MTNFLRRRRATAAVLVALLGLSGVVLSGCGRSENAENTSGKNGPTGHGANMVGPPPGGGSPAAGTQTQPGR